EVAATDAHRRNRLLQDRRPALLGREARDVDGPRRRVHRRELLAPDGQELAERRMRALLIHEVDLREARDARADVVVRGQLARTNAPLGEAPAVVRRPLGDPRERLAEPGDVVGVRRPGHATVLRLRTAARAVKQTVARACTVCESGAMSELALDVDRT